MKFPRLKNLASWRGARPALPVPGEEASAGLRRQLVADFDRARYGITFRTLSFPAKIAGETEYFKALATTPDLDRWDVQKITQRDMQLESPRYPVETGNVKMRVVKTGLGFFEALEYLARFEKSCTDEPVGASKESLGQQHYEAFGLLHDIAFNMQGQPQPTLGGHLAISDDYPVAVLERLQDAQKKTTEKARLAGQALIAAHVNASQIVAGFDAVSRQAAENVDMRKACRLTELWVLLVGDVLSDQDGLVQESQLRRYKALTRSESIHTYLNSFGNCWSRERRFNYLHLKTVEEMTRLKDLNSEDRNSITLFLKEIAALAMAEDAKYLAQTVTAENRAENLGGIDVLAREYGELTATRSPDKKKAEIRFKASILSTARLREIPPHFNDYVAQMKDAVERMSAETQQNWSRIKPPSPERAS